MRKRKVLKISRLIFASVIGSKAAFTEHAYLRLRVKNMHTRIIFVYVFTWSNFLVGGNTRSRISASVSQKHEINDLITVILTVAFC